MEWSFKVIRNKRERRSKIVQQGEQGVQGMRDLLERGGNKQAARWKIDSPPVERR